ncbi:cellular communication network factor protein Ccn [Haematobia irritans]|uniref:cellular communication network factor protein Ccn n=1 Tax=Haematobia irritans TaxID=7368 RepID=UPI003F506C25
MHNFIVPILGVLLATQLRRVGGNLSLDFKVTKISASPANCNVANTTYAHGETFKLDCRTQCVCENGRHACSSLCPKEQLPAPEDTISCRSPRLVEVPGHCCKMWLCENPTADVYATCHNSSSSPWTPCSRPCGLGISTRFTATAAGCNQLINLRLCENRKCDIESALVVNNGQPVNERDDLAMNNANILGNGVYDMGREGRQHQRHHHRHKHNEIHTGYHEHRKHGIKRGHECRHLERLGPARIRLGQCVSRKLYRPKVCGYCRQPSKCCLPSVSTTIQVELLCPLNSDDPISIIQQQEQRKQHNHKFYSGSFLSSLWDTHSLDPIDQEYFQSHQIHIENKFIAIEWILKCDCSENESCPRIAKTQRHDRDSINHANVEDNYNDFYGKIKRNYKHQQQELHDLRNIDDNTIEGQMNDDSYADTVHSLHTVSNEGRGIMVDEKTEKWKTSSLSSKSSMSANSDEIQPDIIPYPPPPFTTNKQTYINGTKNNNNSHRDVINFGNSENIPRMQPAKNLETYRNERQQEQEKYFYEQWLRQQQQQKRQQTLMEQLLGT